MQKIPLISNILERMGRRRLRYIMRGFRHLKESNKLGLITEIKETFTNTPLRKVYSNHSAIIFGAAFDQAEIAIRQFLLVRVTDINFNKSLLYALGKRGSSVVHPLPPEWRAILVKHGFKVAKVHSALAWYGFVTKMLIFGFFSIFKHICNIIKATFQSSNPFLGKYAHFESLGVGNLPKPGNGGRSHDIISWYNQWPGRTYELDTFCHCVKGIDPYKLDGKLILSVKSGIPQLSLNTNGLRFIGWGIVASAIALFDLFRGHWWHALLLGEAAKSAKMRLQNPEMIARDYLFHNSGWIYRPLWTYEAEKHGSRILFYFYSTNCESFKLPEGYPIQANSWQVTNWPVYLVWDQYQADFVRRAVGDNANIIEVGPIWFHSSSNELPPSPLKTVAVFDVQPVRDSFYQTLGLAFDYYIPSVACQFLIDVHSVVLKQKATFALKRKRKINTLAHAKYRRLLANLSESPDFLTINPDISALLVIEKSMAVVSMPFTSTALLGRELGKPSVYYDPTGLIQKDDRAAHGIKILKGTSELNEWLSSVLKNETSNTCLHD